MKAYNILAGAAIAASLFASPATAGTIRLCTGVDGGIYATIGDKIAQYAKDSSMDVVVVKDTGGSWGNIDRSMIKDATDPEACDAFISQPDGPSVLKQGYYDENDKLVGANPTAASKINKVGDLHREYLHVIANKKLGVDNITDLEGDTVKIAVGSAGSGGWLIWQNLTYEDSGYRSLIEEPIGGIEAASAVASGQVGVWIVPAGRNFPDVVEADELYSDQLALIEADDGDFNDAVDPEGNDLYEFVTLDGNTYPGLVADYWSGSIETISWLAGVYINVDRVERADRAGFIRAVAKAKKWAAAEYGN